MKYCKNCGGQVDDNDLYCGYCGSRLKDDPQYYRKQDFDDELEAGASSRFQDDMDKEFDKDFEKQFDDNSQDAVSDNYEYTEYGKADEGNADDFGYNGGGNDNNDVEFESYVENESRRATVRSNNQNSGNKHKTLLINKDAKDANTLGILSLIFGIIYWLGILGLIFGILGLIKAKKALTLCASGEYDGKPKATNGRTLSIIGIVFSVISIIWLIF